MKKFFSFIFSFIFLAIVILIIAYAANVVRAVFTGEDIFSAHFLGVYWQFFFKAIAVLIIFFIFSLIFWGAGLLILGKFIGILENKTGEKVTNRMHQSSISEKDVLKNAGNILNKINEVKK